MQDTFHIAALSTSVAEARRRVVSLLRSWGACDDLRDNAELVVSELITNAVRHTSTERIGCHVRFVTARLRLEVTDHGSARTEPRARSVDSEQEGGRGLMLVDALAETWGVKPGLGGRGRVVWASLA
ncbi:ATP-binding protein [Streptomyces sp. M19]